MPITIVARQVRVYTFRYYRVHLRTIYLHKTEFMYDFFITIRFCM